MTMSPAIEADLATDRHAATATDPPVARPQVPLLILLAGRERDWREWRERFANAGFEQAGIAPDLSGVRGRRSC
ncbi:MAG: hypothetical protein J2P15_01705 [Micromonosporaceae bacterium]|nr:hypothetical protein [Micromonosporaceae bacterium]